MARSKNELFLHGRINQLISDKIEDLSNITKTRSASNDNGPDSLNVFGDLLRTVLIGFSTEVADLLETVHDEAKDERSKLQQEFDQKQANQLNIINDLINQIDNIGQHSRKENFKITGVEVTPEEDIEKIVCDIINHTGVELDANDISVAHRLHTRDDTRNNNGTPRIPSIICRVKDRKIKSAIMTARRNINENPDAPHPGVSIYDDVTPLRSRILFALRNKMNDETTKTYKYVWTREGRIFCRTEQESNERVQHPTTGKMVPPKPHIVNKAQDLMQLGWSNDEIEKIIHNKKD